MIEAKYLIVNADDFGMSPGVNRGIIQAHENGIVTSASLMVRWPSAAAAAEYARDDKGLSVGLHLDLGEWVWREERWTPLYQLVPLDDIVAVREEVSRQLATFADLMDREPSHIDSHQHVHLKEPVRSVAVDAARRIGVPLRDCCPEVLYCGRFYGQTQYGSPYFEGITVDALTRIAAELRLGFTELGCHPGEGEDLNTMYVVERAKEVQALCDPRIRTALAEMGVHLCSFAEAAASRCLQ